MGSLSVVFLLIVHLFSRLVESEGNGLFLNGEMLIQQFVLPGPGHPASPVQPHPATVDGALGFPYSYYLCSFILFVCKCFVNKYYLYLCLRVCVSVCVCKERADCVCGFTPQLS